MKMKLFEKKVENPNLVQAQQNIAMAESQREALFNELGKLVYQRCTTGELKEAEQRLLEVAEYRDLVNRITQAIANREAYYSNYLQLQGYMLCVNCRQQIPYGSVYCPACGSKANEVDEKFMENKLTCGNCGAVMDKGTAFCTGCGNKLQ